MKRNKLLIIQIVMILFLSCFSSINGKTQTKLEQNPVLYLHCWTGSDIQFKTMREWLIKDGWPNNSLFAYTFDWSYFCDWNTSMHKANQVKQWVSEILTTTGAEKLDLICHCFGALHARYYIKYLGGIDYVDDYVSLAGPHHGEPTYEYSCTPGTNELAQYLNEGDASPGGILNDTIGPRKDTIFDDIIYNSTHIPGVISYTSIASRHDEVIPYNSSKLDGAEYILVNDTQHMQMFKDWTVYEYVREAIDDLNINWNGNTAWDFSPIILLTSIIMVVYWKRKKK